MKQSETLRSSGRGQLGCEHAEVRVERIRSQVARLRDGRLETSADDLELGIGLRVVHDGSFGFAATVELTADAAAASRRPGRRDGAGDGAGGDRARRARRRAFARRDAVDLVLPHRPGRGRRWRTRSPCSRTGAAGSSHASGVDHATAYVLAVVEDKHFADLSGTVTTQRRVRLHPVVEATAVDREEAGFETMRSLAPPVGRGWEYLLGDGWDWDEELARIPEYLAEKLHAPTVVPGPTTL